MSRPSDVEIAEKAAQLWRNGKPLIQAVKEAKKWGRLQERLS